MLWITWCWIMLVGMVDFDCGPVLVVVSYRNSDAANAKGFRYWVQRKVFVIRFRSWDEFMTFDTKKIEQRGLDKHPRFFTKDGKSLQSMAAARRYLADTQK